MTWNHRIARRVFHGPTGPEEFLSVYEVYYDDDGNPNGITSNAIAPGGETLDELRTELARMLAATGQPILDYENIARGKKMTKDDCCMEGGRDGHHEPECPGYQARDDYSSSRDKEPSK